MYNMYSGLEEEEEQESRNAGFHKEDFGIANGQQHVDTCVDPTE